MREKHSFKQVGIVYVEREFLGCIQFRCPYVHSCILDLQQDLTNQLVLNPLLDKGSVSNIKNRASIPEHHAYTENHHTLY